MKNLTIAYVTSRRDCRVDWFLESLARQTDTLVRVLVITPYIERLSAIVWRDNVAKVYATFHEPKPNVWQGPHRLTSKDYFAASNARNTAAALCASEWIAYVDDLSVLLPSWLQSVRDAIAAPYIGLGSYRKVLNLNVQDGEIIGYDDHPNGYDSRWDQTEGKDVFNCSGSWMFGCSVVMPMQALLDINGWPECLCDSCGGEDYNTGIVLNNAGYGFKYDRRMMTLEAEELHFKEPAMVRWDPGFSPSDKSHAALNIAHQSKRFANDFGDGMTLAELRAYIKTNPFPIRTNPAHEWFTGMALKDL